MKHILKKYNYFYKIRNKVNNHFYYGIHSTDDLDDGYMGSGHRLKKAYNKYGIENFTKEILKFFDSREEASDYESEVVTEVLVKDNNCYNCVNGGENFNTRGMTAVYDKITKDTKLVSINDFENNINYVSVNKGFVNAKNKNTNLFEKVPFDVFKRDRDKYTIVNEGKIFVRDKQNNYFWVSKNDERLKKGLLLPSTKDCDFTSIKLKETLKRIKHQQGVRNSQYGTCWVIKNGLSKKINKNDLEMFLKEGWECGRRIDMKTKKIDKIDLEEFLKLKEEGLNWTQIQKKLGISKSLCYEFRKLHSIK